MTKQYFITTDDMVIHKIKDGKFDYTKYLGTNRCLVFFETFQEAKSFREEHEDFEKDFLSLSEMDKEDVIEIFVDALQALMR